MRTPRYKPRILPFLALLAGPYFANGETPRPTPLPTPTWECEGAPVDTLEKGDVAPVPLEQPAPAYPPEARRNGLEGRVILEAVVTTSGSVACAHVLLGTGTALDEAALQAVRRWRYQPARRQGRPFAVYLTPVLKFRLPPSPTAPPEPTSTVTPSARR